MCAYKDGTSIKASRAPGQPARGNTRHLYASRSTQLSDVMLHGFLHTVVGREKAWRYRSRTGLNSFLEVRGRQMSAPFT
jgi:hypothetical protein